MSRIRIWQRKKKLGKRQTPHPDVPMFAVILDDFQKKPETTKIMKQYVSSMNKDTPTNEVWKKHGQYPKQNHLYKGHGHHGESILWNSADIANHIAEHFTMNHE